MFKTHTILFSKVGDENACTPPSPTRVYEPGCVDLDAKGTFCVSSDNDMLVSEKLYEVNDVVLPEWLSPQEWLRDLIGWKYAWGAGVDPSWPESWQRGLKELSTARKVAACKLLRTKTFRSDFRRSMRDQIVAWLESTDRKYASPLSPRQWEAIIDRYTAIEAKNLDSSLYRNRYYTGCPAPKAESVSA